jgi:hypothetical protein
MHRAVQLRCDTACATEGNARRKPTHQVEASAAHERKDAEEADDGEPRHPHEDLLEVGTKDRLGNHSLEQREVDEFLLHGLTDDGTHAARTRRCGNSDDGAT